MYPWKKKTSFSALLFSQTHLEKLEQSVSVLFVSLHNRYAVDETVTFLAQRVLFWISEFCLCLLTLTTEKNENDFWKFMLTFKCLYKMLTVHSYIMNNSPCDLISIIDNALMFIIIRFRAWIQQKYLALRFVTIFEDMFFTIPKAFLVFITTRKVDNMLKKYIAVYCSLLTKISTITPRPIILLLFSADSR